MLYRRLGESGLEVSVVGLGTNNFGGRLDLAQTETVLRRAADLGVNLIDTADVYGNMLSEEYIGESIKGIRHDLVLATKVATRVGDGPNRHGGSRMHIMNQVERSLANLDTDYIDLYQMHWPDADTPIEETMRTLDNLVRQGKVRYIGCSNYAVWQVAQAMETAYAMDLEPFISVQPEYSMLRREAETEMVPCCEAYGLGILPYYPLAEGFLTGKFKRGATPLEGTRIARAPGTAETFLTDANFDKLERLEAFAQERGHSILELAFAWLLSNPLVGSVIAGATKTWQVEANAKAADWQLDPDDLLEVNAILDGAD